MQPIDTDTTTEADFLPEEIAKAAWIASTSTYPFDTILGEIFISKLLSQKTNIKESGNEYGIALSS